MIWEKLLSLNKYGDTATRLIIIIPPVHILRCASSRTSFKGGDVIVNIHEKSFRIAYFNFHKPILIDYNYK